MYEYRKKLKAHVEFVTSNDVPPHNEICAHELVNDTLSQLIKLTCT